MAKLDAAVFTISVDNEAEIRAWIVEMGKLRDSIETQFNEMLRLCRERPLIAMTISTAPQHPDGSISSGEAGGE